MTVMEVFKGVRREDWRTPKKLYEQLDKEFHFDFDPCPLNPQFDGLKVEWGQSNFVNPPYGRGIDKWLKKAREENIKGKTSVILIYVQQSSTLAFHKYIYPYAEIRLIRGRLRFDDGNGSAPFGSMLCILRGGKAL
jgi:site-specific DNA-methyltransferase (adenine-specific)